MEHPTKLVDDFFDFGVSHLRVERKGDAACRDMLGYRQRRVDAGEAAQLVDRKRQKPCFDPTLPELFANRVAVMALGQDDAQCLIVGF